MKKELTRRLLAIVVAAAFISPAIFGAYAAVTGIITSTDHDTVSDANANNNIIQSERKLDVGSSYVRGSNKMTWYTFTGTARQLAYCNAIYGTSKVSIYGISSDDETMIPRATTVEILGQDLASGITCTATRVHNLDLVFAEAASQVVVNTPDGREIYTYNRVLRMHDREN